MKDFLIRLGGAHHQPTSPPARSRGNDGGQHADTTDGVHVQQGEHEASPRGVAGLRRRGNKFILGKLVVGQVYYIGFSFPVRG